MKKSCLLLLPFLLLFFPFYAQTVADYTVQVTATVQSSPAEITLSWPPHTDATSFVVTRKLLDGTSWGTPIATLGASDSTYTDTNVLAGETWEYRIRKVAGSYDGWGYILAGIEAEAIHHRGTLILVVDSTYLTDLGPKIERLEMDLVGDGWSVIRHDVDRNDSVPLIKDMIRADYNAAPSEVNSVFLFGHVPVPYSGNFGNNAPWFAPPDAHTNHGGAWPADAYYGEMNGVWTDFNVTNTTAPRSENHNIPGDGKFDQSIIASNIELMVGRVDMEDMPQFPAGEKDLLERYLDKDHAYRHKGFSVPEKAVIDDNFGVFSGEIFAANGWRNFAPLIGPDNVSSGDYRTELNASGHQWSLGCGGGSYTSCNGIGNTSQIESDSLQGVFTLLFGSYFGDWDSQNNFLRAPLANKGTVLAAAWAGRPHWHFHPMGMGQPIGYSARLSQNNQNLYFSSFFYRLPHIALMGDPSLRLHVLAPAANLVVTPIANGAENELNWTASTDPNLGYHVYRSSALEGPYLPITSQPETGLRHTDPCPEDGENFYMVRAVELRTSPSGSYHNLSQGVFDSALNTVSYPSASFTWTINGDNLLLTNTSTNSLTSFWRFGDGDSSTVENPAHGFSQDSTYLVELIVSDGCRMDTLTESIIFVHREAVLPRGALQVYPNPTHDRVIVRFPALGENFARIEVVNLTGQRLQEQTLAPASGKFETVLDLSAFPAGIYLLRYHTSRHKGAVQLLKQ